MFVLFYFEIILIHKHGDWRVSPLSGLAATRLHRWPAWWQVRPLLASETVAVRPLKAACLHCSRGGRSEPAKQADASPPRVHNTVQIAGRSKAERPLPVLYV